MAGQSWTEQLRAGSAAVTLQSPPEQPSLSASHQPAAHRDRADILRLAQRAGRRARHPRDEAHTATPTRAPVLAGVITSASVRAVVATASHPVGTNDMAFNHRLYSHPNGDGLPWLR